MTTRIPRFIVTLNDTPDLTFEFPFTPTEANLKDFVKVYGESFAPGGVNAHVGVDKIFEAKVYLNDAYADGPIVVYFDRAAQIIAD